MFKKKSTVQIHKSKGKRYFRTALPFSVAQVLGLDREAQKQRVEWRIENGKAVVNRA